MGRYLKRPFRLLALAAACIALARWSGSEEAAPPTEKPAPRAVEVQGRLHPPLPPKHARRKLETASELSQDLHEVVVYLEYGQSYYRAYQKGTHTVEENEEFLRFLETYEKEHKVAKTEMAALNKWMREQGGLETRP